jgi:sulfite oxidase
VGERKVVVHTGHIRVKGWAYSGCGRWPERVEVSPDGSSVWNVVAPEDMSEKRKFSWRTWHIDLPDGAEGWL